MNQGLAMLASMRVKVETSPSGTLEPIFLVARFEISLAKFD
jgi:hypothetical protein